METEEFGLTISALVKLQISKADIIFDEIIAAFMNGGKNSDRKNSGRQISWQAPVTLKANIISDAIRNGEVTMGKFYTGVLQTEEGPKIQFLDRNGSKQMYSGTILRVIT